MIDHILVPLDGSSLAERVLPHTVAMGRAMGAGLTLLRAIVRDPEEVQSRAVDPLGWHMRKSEASTYLSEVAQRLRDAGLRTKEVLAEGRAAERIIQYAREEDVDLIVISSHGRSGLSRWNINSVVQKVILRAYVPTLIVRAYRQVTEELTELDYERLLLPLDGSQRAECVLPWARNLADYHGSRIVLAHVVNKPEVPRRAPLTEQEADLVDRLTELNREKGEKYLRDLESRLSMEAETRLLVSENPAAALHNLVDEVGADLVLMAAHGYSGETTWPYGSIALNFIAYGSEPLLIIQDVPPGEAGMTEAERAADEQAGH
jgi:nucleotide-binding universal stress UspA family protein